MFADEVLSTIFENQEQAVSKNKDLFFLSAVTKDLFTT